MKERRRQTEKDAGGDGGIALPRAQPPHRLLNGQERRRTGAVHRVGGAAKVEPIGRPAGRDVGDGRRDILGRARRQRRAQVIFHLAPARTDQFRIAAIEQLQYGLERFGAERQFHQFAGGIAAAANEDVGSLAQRTVLGDAGIAQGRVDDVEHEELIRIAVAGEVGQHAER
ncbi:MAG TPA: hypothetical protein VFU81_00045, partial [Thermomicrobiales bacterium]|nr:hypothetical protein [Thermomicrobiales bacterium]